VIVKLFVLRDPFDVPDRRAADGAKLPAVDIERATDVALQNVAMSDASPSGTSHAARRT
jgi:hypothetical protein